MRYWPAIISSQCDAGMAWGQYHFDAFSSSSHHSVMLLWDDGSITLMRYWPAIISSQCDAGMGKRILPRKNLLVDATQTLTAGSIWMYFNALQCIKMYYNALQCITIWMYYNVLQCTITGDSSTRHKAQFDFVRMENLISLNYWSSEGVSGFTDKILWNFVNFWLRLWK